MHRTRRFFCLLLLLSATTLQAQSLVKLAMNIHLEKDSIQAFASDSVMLDTLVPGFLTPRDVEQLQELNHFVQNPWTQDSLELDKLDVDVVYRVRRARYNSALMGLQGSIPPTPPKRRTRSLFSAASKVAETALPEVSLSTKVIDGTARFIADRFKEELTLAFFENFRRKVAASIELRTLLPNTSDLLLNQDIGAFLSIGPTAKSAFQEDIENLLYSMDELVKAAPEYRELGQDVRYRGFMLTAKTIDLSRKGYPLTDLIRQLYLQEARQRDALGKSIRLAYALTEGLTEVDSTTGKLRLISLADYQLLDSPEKREYFVALMFQRDRSLGSDLIHSQADFQNHFDQFNQHLQELIILVQNADDERKRLQQGGVTQELTNDVIFSYVGYAFDAIDLASRLAYFRQPQDYWDSDFYQFGLPLGKKVIRATKAINAGDHGTALLASVQVISDLLLLSKHRENAAEVERLRENLLLYGNFMVNVLNAQNAEEVRQAIEAVALPVGASRIKKNTLSSISINAYPGLYTGGEWLLNAGEADHQAAAVSFGFTAPVGLAFNWGLRRSATPDEIRRARLGRALERQRAVGLVPAATADTTQGDSLSLDSLDAGTRSLQAVEDASTPRAFRQDGIGRWQTLRESSLSLFLSVVDLGAVVSYRLSQNQAEGLPDNITLRQVFAPGLFVAYGFKRAPISLMLGTQYTPELRQVDASQLTTKYNALRVSLTLAVDIPMFNLFVRPIPY